METNRSTLCGDIICAGISLFFVLGFSASISLSSHRLNDIAAFRAKIRQSKIGIRIAIEGKVSIFVNPNIKPIMAKGKPKMV